MREIKFRVWSDKSKSWLKDENVLSFYISNDGELEIDCSDWSKSKLTIQQYTGLKDKNGVEIYEGDIVERRRERGLVDFNSKNYAQIPGWNLLLYQYVPYQKEGWIYQEKDDEMELPAIEYYYGCPPDKSWEVVGNIFEGVDK